jgi:Ala-tRNA(Pro) deacylase
MSIQLVIEYLDRRQAQYSLHRHGGAYTAPEIAQSGHIHGHSFAKVVMVKLDHELAMMVVPAHYQVDLKMLALVLALDRAELATEREFAHRFPRCEIGAMPPFGHLYGLQTFMVPVFNDTEMIAFNAGTHTEIIRMPLAEYMRLAYVTEVAGGVIPPALAASVQRHSLLQ